MTADLQRVLVFDFGSQYVQLIARRVREQGVYAEIVRHDLPAERVRELAPEGVVLSGGPASVYAASAPKCDPGIFELGVPILGICYGMQLICEHTGGKVENAPAREYGRTQLTVDDAGDLLAGLPDSVQVWMSHGDQVQSVGDSFRALARTATCPAAAVRHRERPVYGVQFHPEVSHTQMGGRILANFVTEVCGCRGDWTMENFLAAAIDRIRTQTAGGRVICGLSGGVDSSVVAALLQRAIGERLACIFVDNGLLRQGEREQVEQTFTGHFGADLHVVDAAELFLSRLAGVADPQEKRKVIGATFIDVFAEEAKDIDDAKFLAQGTLYPDVIESGSSVDGPASVIKAHHNVGGLPEKLDFTLVEPLRELFKDEVRKLGEQLGLPSEMVWRHPFPGPGLAVRCLGPVEPDKLRILREADAIFLHELRDAGLYRSIAQAFAVILPVQAVGVMGDDRTYEAVVCLRAVTTDDFMTADWARIDADVLGRCSTRIINEVRGVNRVVYDVSTKPPATIEWE